MKIAVNIKAVDITVRVKESLDGLEEKIANLSCVCRTLWALSLYFVA